MRRLAVCVAASFAWAMLMGAATGAWLKKVPDAQRVRVNPLAGRPDAIAAGGNLYQNNCAQCHGADGNGRGSRPAVRSPRMIAATDGELFWLLRNGEPFRGMPSWVSLPEGQRWQIIAYLRSIQPHDSDPAVAVSPGGKP